MVINLINYEVLLNLYDNFIQAKGLNLVPLIKLPLFVACTTGL